MFFVYLATLLIGAAAICMSLYGFWYDYKNKYWPLKLSEATLAVGVLVSGLAVVVTAIKAMS